MVSANWLKIGALSAAALISLAHAGRGARAADPDSPPQKRRAEEPRLLSAPAQSRPTPIQADRQPESAPPSPAQGRSLLQSAYTKSQALEQPKSSGQERDFTEIIELCQDAVKSGLDRQSAGYARSLTAWAHNRRGEFRANHDQDDEALADFEAAVALDPRCWRAVHNRGVSYGTQGKHREAVEDFSRTIQLKPDYANAYFNRGELRYEQDDFEGAIGDYGRALRLAPRDAATYNSRGHALYRLGRYQEALKDYSQAVALEPDDAAVYTNRGDAYADLGFYHEAAGDYRTAIRLDPKLGRAYQSAAWLMATCPDARYRNEPLALEAAKKSIDLAEAADDYRYLETLAAAEANAGHFDEAREIEAKVIELVPKAEVPLHRKRLEMFAKNTPYRAPSHETVRAGDNSQARQPRSAPR